MLPSGCQESIDQAVYFDLNTSLNLSQLKTSEGCINHSKMADSVTTLEDLISRWCQQIEKVGVVRIRMIRVFGGCGLWCRC